jgi:hypothetical protein
MMLTSDACFVLDLVDECCLDDHYGCHYGDHGEELSWRISIVGRRLLDTAFHSPKDDGRSDQSGTKE